jgi:hypothetical protein
MHLMVNTWYLCQNQSTPWCRADIGVVNVWAKNVTVERNLFDVVQKQKADMSIEGYDSFDAGTPI